MQKFAIKTDVFEGPLELLLELVEKRKLLINDISLASVTDEFMEHVSRLQEERIYHTSHFVVVAATLLLIKSKSLLPVLQLTEEEEQSIGELEARLERYQIYRNAARSIETHFGKNLLFNRQFKAWQEPIFTPDTRTTIDSLKSAIHDVLQNLPKPTAPESKATVRNVITLEEMIERLEARIETKMKCTFGEVTKGEQEKKNLVVCFLAILELYKQGRLLVVQAAEFEDIELEGITLTTPRYS